MFEIDNKNNKKSFGYGIKSVQSNQICGTNTHVITKNFFQSLHLITELTRPPQLVKKADSQKTHTHTQKRKTRSIICQVSPSPPADASTCQPCVGVQNSKDFNSFSFKLLHNA